MAHVIPSEFFALNRAVSASRAFKALFTDEDAYPTFTNPTQAVVNLMLDLRSMCQLRGIEWDAVETLFKERVGVVRQSEIASDKLTGALVSPFGSPMVTLIEALPVKTELSDCDYGTTVLGDITLVADDVDFECGSYSYADNPPQCFCEDGEQWSMSRMLWVSETRRSMPPSVGMYRDLIFMWLSNPSHYNDIIEWFFDFFVPGNARLEGAELMTETLVSHIDAWTLKTGDKRIAETLTAHAASLRELIGATEDG